MHRSVVAGETMTRFEIKRIACRWNDGSGVDSNRTVLLCVCGYSVWLVHPSAQAKHLLSVSMMS